MRTVSGLLATKHLRSCIKSTIGTRTKERGHQRRGFNHLSVTSRPVPKDKFGWAGGHATVIGRGAAGIPVRSTRAGNKKFCPDDEERTHPPGAEANKCPVAGFSLWPASQESTAP